MSFKRDELTEKTSRSIQTIRNERTCDMELLDRIKDQIIAAAENGNYSACAYSYVDPGVLRKFCKDNNLDCTLTTGFDHLTIHFLISWGPR